MPRKEEFRNKLRYKPIWRDSLTGVYEITNHVSGRMNDLNISVFSLFVVDTWDEEEEEGVAFLKNFYWVV